ncbi:hypothetical protein KUV75_08790 [Qipengyuania gaetbuli]|uniref:sensor histidine kinase n=1 Tax=Qipengyuania gaetbuli TaxID=266952 RepID=UPI001C992A58|nr:histidine kinase [Qipengyuania gaetbuli]MBY6015000.1 hypothetical protein [Qipengyuania gaetbuli]
MSEVLDQCAERLAFFLGYRSARFTPGGEGSGIAIRAVGNEEPLGFIAIEGLAGERDIRDEEDRETFRLYLELMGAAIDRNRRDGERQRLVETLLDREKRLEMLVERMFSAQESERLRVSQELHDGVAQTATALARLIEGSGSEAPDLPAAERARLAEIARGLVRELRAVIGGLRPTLLDDLGLEAAIRALADGLEDEGYRVSVSLTGSADRLPRILETALFRVAQEAIANIRKHAGVPCAVGLELALPKEGRSGFLRIVDTGRGPPGDCLPQEDSGKHIGIGVMSERMTAVGGSLEWRAGERGGVIVTAYLPEVPAP